MEKDSKNTYESELTEIIIWLDEGTWKKKDCSQNPSLGGSNLAVQYYAYDSNKNLLKVKRYIYTFPY